MVWNKTFSKLRMFWSKLCKSTWIRASENLAFPGFISYLSYAICVFSFTLLFAFLEQFKRLSIERQTQLVNKCIKSPIGIGIFQRATQRPWILLIGNIQSEGSCSRCQPSWLLVHSVGGQSLLCPRWWHRELKPTKKPEPLTETIVFIYYGVHFNREAFQYYFFGGQLIKIWSPSSSIFIPTFRLPATTYIFLFHVHVESKRHSRSSQAYLAK